MTEKGWDPADDPGSLLVKMPLPKAEPHCHCPPIQKARQGGMQPAIDLDAAVIRCKGCLREIGPACRTSAVRHLRGLLRLSQERPEHFHLEGCRDAGWLL